MEEFNLLVVYGSTGYFSARREVEGLLTSLGDRDAVIEITDVQGVLGVKTMLNAREVVRDVKDRFASNPQELRASEVWIPVDEWCAVGEIKSCVRELRSQIMPDETVQVRVEVRGSNVSSDRVKKDVISVIPNQQQEGRADKLVFVFVIKDRAGVSILKQSDVLTTGAW